MCNVEFLKVDIIRSEYVEVSIINCNIFSYKNFHVYDK